MFSRFKILSRLTAFIAAFSVAALSLSTYAAEPPAMSKPAGSMFAGHLQTYSSSDNVLHLVHQTTTYEDPTYGTVNMTISIATSTNEQEYKAGEAWMKREMNAAARRDEETGLTLMSADGDAPETIPQISTPEIELWRIKPEKVQRFTFIKKKWMEFSSFLGGQIDGLKDDLQKLDVDRQASVLDRRIAREKLKAARAGKTTLDKFVSHLNDQVPNPFYPAIQKNKSQKTVSRYVRNFSVVRMVTTAGVIFLGYILNKEVPLPVLATLIGALGMGSISFGLMWNFHAYTTWIDDQGGRFSRWILRPPVKAAGWIIHEIFGKRAERIKRYTEHFQDTVTHKVMNSLGKFGETEYVFFAPIMVALAAAGGTLYPETMDMITGVNYDGTLLDSLEYVVKSQQYVWGKLSIAVGSAILGQGLWEAGNSRLKSGALHEIKQQAISHDITYDVAHIKSERIIFTSNMIGLGVSMTSNLGVVMGMPESKTFEAIGNGIIVTLAGSGGIYYGYALIRYNEKAHNFFRQYILREPADYKPCIMFLTKYANERPKLSVQTPVD